MSAPASPGSADCHPQEKDLLRFLERDDQSADYVRRCSVWLRETYPGSAAVLIPRMREIYRRKTVAAGKK